MLNVACILSALAALCAGSAGTHQATGVKVGEVTPDSAMVWVRLTANEARLAQVSVSNAQGTQPAKPELRVEQREGACPGMPGRVRVRYGTSEGLANATATDWVDVTETGDFAHVFRLKDLRPATVYHYATETAARDGQSPHEPLRGSFKTAPPADAAARVTFTVVTGQMYKDLDDPDGFHIYETMLQLKPDFIVPTGDTVYYDNDPPLVTSVPLARYHWHRMYSLPRLVRFHLQVPAYWEKDDHDTYHNDCWPGFEAKAMRPFTFEDGLRVIREQVPVGEVPYRTFRWGRHLQVWLTEGRDFRSPNDAPDGPDKSIWGKTQRAWLEQTLLASDATWKVLISPTPIVGPDRQNKADNHANKAFTWEGNYFRRWAAENLPRNFFVACGDRHWQYHSVDPATGVQEFSCGPVSDQHAEGSPGRDPVYHRFHRMKGGFLSVTVDPGDTTPAITFSFHDIHGQSVYSSVAYGSAGN